MLRCERFMARLCQSNFSFRLLFGALVLLSIVFLLVDYGYTQPDVRYCFMEPETKTAKQSQMSGSNQPQRLEDVLLAPLQPNAGGRSIFFHETSCHQPPKPSARLADTLFGSTVTAGPIQDTSSSVNLNLVQLNARQACAIESAALHNPNFSVFVLFASPTYRDNATAQPQPLLDAILAYSNVHLRNLNLWTYASGTPIYDWLKNGDLFRSKYVLSHISDFLRYVTLWRYGGTYLDLDIIMLRSMEQVPPNYTGAESNTDLAAGIMNFAPNGFGHEIAQMCLSDFERHFNPFDWGNNGPGVITRVMQSVCGTKNIELMLDRRRCMGFRVFPRDAFYAIPWSKWEYFFDPQYFEETLRLTENSYVAHVWNKHSKQRRVEVGGSQVAYGKLAEQHCPKVYAAAGEYF